MSTELRRWPYVQTDGKVVNDYLCDTEAELPANAVIGSRALTKDTDKEWIVNSAGNWQEVGGAGGSHPDLATHNILGLATQTELDNGLAAKADTHSHPYAADNHTHEDGGGQAFPLGSIYISVDSTNPATTLGYGTWAAFGTGRVLVGFDSGDADFDTAEETGGAKTHTHDAHTQGRKGGTTNPLDIVNTPSHSTTSHLPPYVVVYMWKRTV